MIRQTSRDAYNEIKTNGLLSERRWQVYSLLYEHGPLTGSEMALKFKAKYGILAPNQANMLARVGELREMGVAREVSEHHICPITGHRVILWDVTDKLPKKRTKSKEQMWQDEVWRLQARIKKLMKKINASNGIVPGHTTLPLFEARK